MNNRIPNIKNVPVEIIYEICLQLPPEDILRLISTSKSMRNLKDNQNNKMLWENLWEYKSKLHFPHLTKTEESWFKHFINAYGKAYQNLLYFEDIHRVHDNYSNVHISAVFSEVKERMPLERFLSGSDNSLDYDSIINKFDFDHKNLIDWYRDTNQQKNLDFLYEKAIAKKTQTIPNILMAILCRQPEDTIEQLLNNITDDIGKLREFKNYFGYYMDTYFINNGIRQIILNASLKILAADGRNELVKRVLKEGAGVDSNLDHDGFTALAAAIQNGHTDVVQTLVDAGADLTIKLKYDKLPFEEGDLPIHMAARVGNKEIIEILLKKHFDGIKKGNARYLTPWQCALAHGHREIAEFLKSESVKNPQTVKNNSSESVKNPQTLKDDSIQTALHWAASGNQVQLMDELLKEGFLVDVKVKHDPMVALPLDATPLMLAAERGNFEAVEFLVEHKADVNATSINGNTALHYLFNEKLYLTENGLKILRYLIQNGANVNATNMQGDTPLHLAVALNRVQGVKILLENNASVTIKNNSKKTPLQCAKYDDETQFKNLIESSFLIHSFLAKRDSLFSKKQTKSCKIPFILNEYEQKRKEKQIKLSAEKTNTVKEIKILQEQIKKSPNSKETEKLSNLKSQFVKLKEKLKKEKNKIATVSLLKAALFNKEITSPQLYAHLGSIAGSKKLRYLMKK